MIKNIYRYLLPFITAFFLLLLGLKTINIYEASKGNLIDGVGYYGHWGGFWIYFAILIVLHFINFKTNKQPFFFDKNSSFIALLYLLNLVWLFFIIRVVSSNILILGSS